jgi:hypothetical protein
MAEKSVNIIGAGIAGLSAGWYGQTFGPPFGPGIPRGCLPVFFMQMALSSMHRKLTGYPIGGSLEFPRAIER